MNQSINSSNGTHRTNRTKRTTRTTRLGGANRSNPYTVSVYPIQQEPGVWFATYLIAEYKNGAERIVANVSMRHATHRTEAQAKQAARRAAEHAAAGMRLQ